MSVNFRMASEKDCASLLFWIRQLAIYEKLEHQVSATEDALRETLFGAKPVAKAIMIEQSGKTIGFAVICDLYSTFKAAPVLYLEDLYIDDSMRGQGIGGRFFDWLETYAAEHGYARVQWSVLDWNEPAINFYRKRGAEILEDWRLCRLESANNDSAKTRITG